jgi:hypothetical protein
LLLLLLRMQRLHMQPLQQHQPQQQGAACRSSRVPRAAASSRLVWVG